MTIGLDLGSHQFRSIRAQPNQLVARSCPAVYAAMSDTPAHRRLLQQSSTAFATCSEHLVVFGESAREWSAMLNLTATPLLRGGQLASDPVSRQVLTLMIDAVLPPPEKTGTLCKMTLPGGGLDQRIKNHDADFFQQLVALRGYRPEILTSTRALALAELTSAGFTGVAISLGHSTSEFGVIHCGRELVRCVVMNGLDQFENLPQLGDGDPKSEPLTIDVEREYRRFFSDVIAEARDQFEFDGTLKTFPNSLPVVCAGGITASPAFVPLFQQVWDAGNWPVATLPIRVSTHGALSIARGCLIDAELERLGQREAA